MSQTPLTKEEQSAVCKQIKAYFLSHYTEVFGNAYALPDYEGTRLESAARACGKRFGELVDVLGYVPFDYDLIRQAADNFAAALDMVQPLYYAEKAAQYKPEDDPEDDIVHGRVPMEKVPYDAHWRDLR